MDDIILLRTIAQDTDSSAYFKFHQSHIEDITSFISRLLERNPQGPHAWDVNPVSHELAVKVIEAACGQRGYLSYATKKKRAEQPCIKLGTWILTRAVWEVRRYLARERKFLRGVHDTCEGYAVAGEPSPLEVLIESEEDAARQRLYHLLVEHIDKLPEIDRQLCQRRWLEGEAYPGICDDLGLTYNAAKMRLSRIGEKMRRLYGEQYYALRG